MFPDLFTPMSLTSMFPEMKELSQINVPMNVYVDKEKAKVIEVAVCGKTKEDMSVSYEFGDDGFASLMIDFKDEEETEDATEKEYQVHKLKKITKKLGLVIENRYDMDKLSCKVENGLLTIKIPVKEQCAKKVVDIQ